MAKRMKSVRSTSSISAVTSRMMKEIWNRASEMAGMTSAARPLGVRNPVVQKPRSTTLPRPKAGSHLSSIEKTRISMMPMTKAGTETPIIEIRWQIRAMTVPPRMAAKTPSGKPIRSAMIEDTSTSSKVAGKRSAITSMTGIWLR